MKYLFLAYDHSSPYSEENMDTRKFNALRDSGLEAKDLQERIVLDATIKYEVLTKTRLSKMLKRPNRLWTNLHYIFIMLIILKLILRQGKPNTILKTGLQPYQTLESWLMD